MSSTILQAIIWIAAGAALVMLMMRRRNHKAPRYVSGAQLHGFFPRQKAVRADTAPGEGWRGERWVRTGKAFEGKTGSQPKQEKETYK